MRFIIALLLLSFGSPAMAQQQPSHAETALQINNIIGTWAQTLTQQGKTIGDLQEELAKANARIKELETKAEKSKG